MRISFSGKSMTIGNDSFANWIKIKNFKTIEDVVRCLLMSRNAIIKALENKPIRLDTAIAISEKTGISLNEFNIKPRSTRKNLSKRDIKEIEQFGDVDPSWVLVAIAANLERLNAFRNGDTTAW